MPEVTPGNEWRGRIALGVLAGALLVGYGAFTRHGPALADEHVYLAGAKHFAQTGHLDARFYDARAILRQGHPHHDVHGPGYAILLGSLMAAVRGSYATAVALNVVAYLAGAFLVHALSRGLGFGEDVAQLAAALHLLLPAYLPFVFWVMPEVVLGTLFLGALVLADRHGERTWAAIVAAIVFGAGLLVRESLAFGAPAVMASLWGRGKLRAFVGTLALFVLVVHVPLSRDRAQGGINFWDSPTDGPRRGGFAVLHAARQGNLGETLAYGWTRVRANVRQASEAGITEKALLALDVLLPLWALAGRRSSQGLARRCLLGLAAGWLALVVSILVLFVVGRWSGFRYLMFLMPAFLPWVAQSIAEQASARTRRALAAVTGLVFVSVDASVLAVHNEYKVSRQRRQEAISAYVERYVGTTPIRRIALVNGWQFGLQHYPTEVISSLPPSDGELRALERAVWFDYIALPGDSPLAAEIEGRLRYVRVNPDDASPPLKIYRRLR